MIMLILGLESSCDETAAAVVEGGLRVRSSVIASQHDIHAEYAGVVPELAIRAHVERLTPTLRRALSEAGVMLADIDAVAVGHRPGLIGSLLVGVAAAKALAWSLGTPFIGVDHIHAHLYAGCLDRGLPELPALGLVVSGGHTSLFLVERLESPKLLGRTIDDAVGEAYDKVATILGLAYPGGPALDALAQTPGADEHAHDFPISRLEHPLDFSFSGLKTAVLYAVRGVPQRASKGGGGGFPREASALSEQERADVAASFQRAAAGAILGRVQAALEGSASGARSLLVGGGVSANSRLRRELAGLAQRRGLDLRLPPLAYCLDNAAMIAGLAHRLLEVRGPDDLSLCASPMSAL
jgi:N6-L-threonylcarbamoyladenine synthase